MLPCSRSRIQAHNGSISCVYDVKMGVSLACHCWCGAEGDARRQVLQQLDGEGCARVCALLKQMPQASVLVVAQAKSFATQVLSAWLLLTMYWLVDIAAISVTGFASAPMPEQAPPSLLFMHEDCTSHMQAPMTGLSTAVSVSKLQHRLTELAKRAAACRSLMPWT